MSGILSAIPIIGRVVEKGLDVVDEWVEDKDQANKLKAEIKKQIEAQTHEADIAELKAQAGIIGKEAQGESWLQRNWRPLLMLTVIIIIFNNYVLVPYAGAIWPDYVHVLELPSGLWALLNVGVGGYVGGRSVEKIIRERKRK